MNCSDFIYRQGGPHLTEMPTSTMGEFRDDDHAREELARQADDLSKHHAYLMAHRTNGLVVIFQGMDAAGKDEAIRHVMSVVDPQGCEVKMFKSPTEKEVRHDFLWRTALAAPARGQLGIFNRSYYEQIVSERVHPEHLDTQMLPPDARVDVFEKRARHIVNYEEYLLDQGIHVVKLFFHVSKEEQRRRLIERIDREDKRWDFTKDDVEEREFWDEYMLMYDEAFHKTSTTHAPWHIIPADKRWFSRATAATIITEKLKSLHSGYPEPGDQQKELDEARAELERQGEPSGAR